MAQLFAAAVLAVCVLVPSTVQAASTDGAVTGPASLGPMVPDVFSNGWAGYFGTGNDPTGFTSATGRMTIPAFVCPDAGSQGVNAGIGWSTVPDPVGTELAGLTFVFQCHAGVPTISAHIYNADSRSFVERPLNVAFNSTLSVSFAYDRLGHTVRVVGTNVTTGESVTIVRSGVADIPWINVHYLADGGLPVPAFKNMRFYGLTLDGMPPATAASLTKTTAVLGTTVLLRASRFTPSGHGFKVWLVHAQLPTLPGSTRR